MKHPDKGRILFEEKRISLKGMWSIILLLYLLLFILIIIASSKHLDLGVLKTYFGLVFLTSPLLIYPIFQREHIVLYENGFYAPYNSFRILMGKKHFISYEEIRFITPYYRNGLAKGMGFMAITKNGKHTYIPNAKDREGMGIQEALKEILGGRWDEIYSDFPILTEKEKNSLGRKVLKSDRRIFCEVLFIMISPSSLFFIGYILNSIVLKFVGIFLFFFSIFSGVVVVSDQYYQIKMARTMYQRMPKNHPMYSFFSMLSEKRPEMKKKEFLMGNPTEEAKKFTDDDWKRLMDMITGDSLRNLVSEILAIALFGFFIFGCFLIHWNSLISLFILFLLSAGLFVVLPSKKDGAILFLNEVIRYEHTRKERIIPDWFKIDNAERKGIKFRDKPQYADEIWDKLFRHWRIATQKISISILLLGFLASLAGFIVGCSPSTPTLCPLISVILLAISLFGLAVLEKYSDAKVVTLVLEYENETGEMAIPKKYRKIAYIWLKKNGKSPPRTQKS